MAKPKVPKHISPKGVAMFPWLNRADTKFNADGDFKVTLRVPASEAEDFCQKIDAAIAAYRPEAMEKLKDAKLKASFKKAGKIDAKGNPHIHKPYTEVLNDAGEETGELDFAFKLNAVGKDGKGKTWKNRIVMFDAHKTELKGINVWGGSEIKVRCTLNPYLTVLAGLGVSLRMDAIQIFKLVESNGANAEGFDDSEEGDEIQSRDEATAGGDADDAGAGDEF